MPLPLAPGKPEVPYPIFSERTEYIDHVTRLVGQHASGFESLKDQHPPPRWHTPLLAHQSHCAYLSHRFVIHLASGAKAIWLL